MTFTQIIRKYKTYIVVTFDSEWLYTPMMYVKGKGMEVIKSKSRINTLYNKDDHHSPYFNHLLEYYSKKEPAIRYVIRNID